MKPANSQQNKELLDSLENMEAALNRLKNNFSRLREKHASVKQKNGNLA